MRLNYCENCGCALCQTCAPCEYERGQAEAENYAEQQAARWFGLGLLLGALAVSAIFLFSSLGR